MKKILPILVGMLLFVGSAQAAISRNPLSTNNGPFTTATSIPVTIGHAFGQSGNGVLVGDVCWVAITRDVQTSITPPSGYTSAITSLNFNTAANNLALFYHVYAAGDPTLVTFTSAATTGTWAVSCYTGAAAAPTLSTGSSSANAASKTGTSTTITPTSVHDMLLMVYGTALVAGQAFSAPSEGNIAAVDVTNAGTAIVDNLLAVSTGTGTQTVTLAQTAANGGIQISMGPLAAPTATATPTPTPTPTMTVTPTITPTPTSTPTPIVVNLTGVAGVPIAIPSCASTPAAVVFKGNKARVSWKLMPEGSDIRCTFGGSDNSAPPIAPSATVGFLLKSNILVSEPPAQTSSSAAPLRLDCCGPGGATSCSTWEN